MSFSSIYERLPRPLSGTVFWQKIIYELIFGENLVFEVFAKIYGQKQLIIVTLAQEYKLSGAGKTTHK